MICKRLTEAYPALFQLVPQPAVGDIIRAVCGACNRTETCPCLTFDLADRSTPLQLPDLATSVSTASAQKDQ